MLGIASRKFELMQADDGGDAVRLADRVQQAEHAIGGGGIKARDRLVGKDECRLLNERARDADALLLAAGQLVGTTQGIVDQPGTLDRVERETFLRRRQRQQRAQAGMVAQASRQHVAQDRRTADELVLLEHHAGAATMHAHGAASTQNSDPFDHHAPGGRLDETVERPQQGRFAGAGCAEQDRELAPLEAERRRRKRMRSGGIDDFEVFDLDHVRGTSGTASAEIPPAHDRAMTVG